MGNSLGYFRIAAVHYNHKTFRPSDVIYKAVTTSCTVYNGNSFMLFTCYKKIEDAWNKEIKMFIRWQGSLQSYNTIHKELCYNKCRPTNILYSL